MTNNRTRMASRAPGKPHQKGVVLIVVLMMLIGITLISMAAVNTSVMELRMARNAEFGVNNFQTALSAIDFVISDPAHLPTLGPLMQTTPVPLTGTVFAVASGDTRTPVGFVSHSNALANVPWRGSDSMSPMTFCSSHAGATARGAAVRKDSTIRFHASASARVVAPSSSAGTSPSR